MMNALRLNAGVPRELFMQRTGLPLIVCEAAFRQAIAQGLLEDSPEQIRPTALGQRFLNDLLTLFL